MWWALPAATGPAAASCGLTDTGAPGAYGAVAGTGVRGTYGTARLADTGAPGAFGAAADTGAPGAYGAAVALRDRVRVEPAPRGRARAGHSAEHAPGGVQAQSGPVPAAQSSAPPSFSTQRADVPRLRVFRTGSKSEALRVAAGPDLRQEGVHRMHELTHAATAWKPRAARLALWEAVAQAAGCVFGTTHSGKDCELHGRSHRCGVPIGPRHVERSQTEAHHGGPSVDGRALLCRHLGESSSTSGLGPAQAPRSVSRVTHIGATRGMSIGSRAGR